MTPILTLSDKRLLKQKDKYAVLCWNKRQQKFHFFHLEEIPAKWFGWQPIKIVKAARSGFTISESIYQMNKEIERVKISRKRTNIQA